MTNRLTLLLVLLVVSRCDHGLPGSRSDCVLLDTLEPYQQTTDTTCGPASLLAFARFYGVPGLTPEPATERRIAREVGTRGRDVAATGGRPGTRPDEMVAWLQRQGLPATVSYESQGDGSQLRRLVEHLRAGRPALAAWSDLGGHWVIVVGFDDRGNDDPWDDLLVLADPYDRYDETPDGYVTVNANRFYWSWYEPGLSFDALTWRTMITIDPAAAVAADRASQKAR